MFETFHLLVLCVMSSLALFLLFSIYKKTDRSKKWPKPFAIFWAVSVLFGTTISVISNYNSYTDYIFKFKNEIYNETEGLIENFKLIRKVTHTAEFEVNNIKFNTQNHWGASKIIPKIGFENGTLVRIKYIPSVNLILAMDVENEAYKKLIEKIADARNHCINLAIIEEC